VNVNRAAIDFDLSGIPAEANIDSARFSVFFNTTSAYGDQHEGETAFIIQRITSGWNESSVTMENQVMVDGAILPTQDFPDIDVTQLIGDYVHDRENSHGLLLRFQNENPYKVALLASSDHPIEQLRPKLEVHYSISE
jgi:hypothetical protein